MAAPQRTHYDVLGIARDADAGAVRSAWKLHVQAWHPDRFTGEMHAEAERQTQAINQAYTVLRDSGRRAAYDCTLAAQEAATRPEPAPRTSYRVRPPVAPRPSDAPVGSPMAIAEPATLGSQVAAITSDAWSIVRRHPRVFAAAASVWVLVFGGSVVMHAVSGPDMPTSAPAAHAAAVVADPQQAEDLEDLAERAREESAEAEAELQQLMLEDAKLARAEAAAIAREAALAAKAARAARKPGAKPATRGRVVRVMPTTTGR